MHFLMLIQLSRPLHLELLLNGVTCTSRHEAHPVLVQATTRLVAALVRLGQDDALIITYFACAASLVVTKLLEVVIIVPVVVDRS